MASLSFNSLPLPPSQPRKQSDSSSLNGGLKPIVVRGNPPTFVSAPGRRIVAGLLFSFTIRSFDIHLVLGDMVFRAIDMCRRIPSWLFALNIMLAS